MFLHSHAGPPDTSVPGTHGGLCESCEYLPRGRPQARGRESQEKQLKRKRGVLCRSGRACIDPLHTVQFSLSSVRSRVEGQNEKV